MGPSIGNSHIVVIIITSLVYEDHLFTFGRGKEVLGIVHLSFKVRPRKGIRDTKRVVVISGLYSDGLYYL